MKNRIQLLNDFRSFMKKERLNMFVVSATDEYLSEYNRLEANSRYLLTGFSGSTGDAVVTQERVFLFVDGRYHLQADMEVDHDYVEVVKVGMDKSPQTAMFEKLAELSNEGAKIGIVSSKTSCAQHKWLLKLVEKREIVEYEADPLYDMADIAENSKTLPNLREVPLNIAGKSAKEKLGEVNAFCAENGIDLLLITSLPEIAWLTNIRGEEIPYSSCYKAKAAVFREQLHVFREENEFEEFIYQTENVLNVHYHPASTTLSTLRKLERQFKDIVELKESPIDGMKAIKNPSELGHYREIFLKTDIVVSRVIAWLNQNLEDGVKVDEKAFSDKVKELFTEEGATGLSFEPITASGKNTAIIHYTTPDKNKFIEAGELVLLDCGGYFEGGYATDQTRTFLAGGSGAQDWQKQVYTAVLKGFLRGLNFEITEDTTGFDIDAAVREVVNANKPEGFEFSHGTGHGVGISVHESPPRIGSSEASKTQLKAGMVFTIEPGLYNENLGGVRIENTVAIAAKDGKARIRTLTRASLDENLINYDMLDETEKRWLNEYKRLKIG